MITRIFTLIPFVAGGLLMANHLPAQIAYSGPQNIEIGPAYDLPANSSFKTAPNTFKIDFNLDGTSDIALFRSTVFSGSSILIVGVNGGGFSFFPGVHIHDPNAREEFLSSPYWRGDQIDSTAYFGGSDFPFIINSGSEAIPRPRGTGLFDPTGGYIGVRFDAVDGVHFGWVQYATDATGARGRVFDWAWETTPNAAIVAGDIGLPAVPEPSTYTFVGVTTLGLLMGYRQRRRN